MKMNSQQIPFKKLEITKIEDLERKKKSQYKSKERQDFIIIIDNLNLTIVIIQFTLPFDYNIPQNQLMNTCQHLHEMPSVQQFYSTIQKSYFYLSNIFGKHIKLECFILAQYFAREFVENIFERIPMPEFNIASKILAEKNLIKTLELQIFKKARKMLDVSNDNKKVVNLRA